MAETEKSFAIRIELGSSIIPGRRYHLDGLLGALIFERTGDAQKASMALPLARRGSVWSASACLLETPCAVIPHDVIQTLRPAVDLRRDLFRPERRGYPMIRADRGSYQNVVEELIAYEASAVWFAGTGHVNAVRDLLSDATSIGRKRSSGRGQIKRVDIEETCVANAGWSFPDRTPARAIPVGEWCGDGPVERAVERWTPPYWRGDMDACVVPSHLVVGRAEAMRLTGVD